jgi:hypothetical protein
LVLIVVNLANYKLISVDPLQVTLKVNYLFIFQKKKVNYLIN